MKIFVYWNSQAVCVLSTSSYTCFHHFNYYSYALVYYSQSEWSLSLTADSQQAQSAKKPAIASNTEITSANDVEHTQKNWSSSRCRCCWCELFSHIWQQDIIAYDVKSNESVWCAIIKRSSIKYTLKEVQCIYLCLAHNFGLGHCIQANGSLPCTLLHVRSALSLSYTQMFTLTLYPALQHLLNHNHYHTTKTTKSLTAQMTTGSPSVFFLQGCLLAIGEVTFAI